MHAAGTRAIPEEETDELLNLWSDVVLVMQRGTEEYTYMDALAESTSADVHAAIEEAYAPQET